MTAILAAAITLVSFVQLEQDRIADAIKRVEDSPLVFIRNGTEYTGKQAADHLRDKLKRAKVKTFDDFVDKIASKSSMSGQPYLVKMQDGKTVELAKWLRETPATQPAR